MVFSARRRKAFSNRCQADFPRPGRRSSLACRSYPVLVGNERGPAFNLSPQHRRGQCGQSVRLGSPRAAPADRPGGWDRDTATPAAPTWPCFPRLSDLRDRFWREHLGGVSTSPEVVMTVSTSQSPAEVVDRFACDLLTERRHGSLGQTGATVRPVANGLAVVLAPPCYRCQTNRLRSVRTGPSGYSSGGRPSFRSRFHRQEWPPPDTGVGFNDVTAPLSI